MCVILCVEQSAEVRSSDHIPGAKPASAQQQWKAVDDRNETGCVRAPGQIHLPCLAAPWQLFGELPYPQSSISLSSHPIPTVYAYSTYRAIGRLGPLRLFVGYYNRFALLMPLSRTTYSFHLLNILLKEFRYLLQRGSGSGPVGI